MRSADVVGKTISSIGQQRTQNIDGDTVYDVQVIRFTDGSKLMLTAGDNHYALFIEAYLLEEEVAPNAE